MDFEKEMNEKDIVGGELTPMINTKRPQTKGLRSGNTQYFTNIDGKYVKDAEARAELADVEEYVYGALEPWQPLEDGYSNFWFELTNDTLSPWLNFSAKTNDAVIDWGDGSGEVALDTLTPTHTYSKAGKYVVKVKGVTRVARIFAQPFNINYNNALKYIEFNNEVTHFPMYCYQYSNGLRGVSIATIPVNFLTYVFAACPNLEKVYLPSGMEEIPQSTFNSDYSIKNITLPSSLTTLGISAFTQCVGLTSITLPSTITTLNNSALQACYSLLEVHCQATTPPTLGNNVFLGLPSDWLCYVPVGYGDTYKAASGWSTYADHILEEGQTRSRAMLSKSEDTLTDEPNTPEER